MFTPQIDLWENSLSNFSIIQNKRRRACWRGSKYWSPETILKAHRTLIIFLRWWKLRPCLLFLYFIYKMLVVMISRVWELCFKVTLWNEMELLASFYVGHFSSLCFWSMHKWRLKILPLFHDREFLISSVDFRNSSKLFFFTWDNSKCVWSLWVIQLLLWLGSCKRTGEGAVSSKVLEAFLIIFGVSHVMQSLVFHYRI